MIFHILIPTEERRALRREYRIRLAIILLFFVSIALVLGTISLFPSYLYTVNLEKAAMKHRDALISSRKKSGADEIEKVLLLNQVTAQKIIAEEDKVLYSDIVQKILEKRKKEVSVISLYIDRKIGTSTAADVTLRGKATTREALLAYKKALEDSGSFTDVELPLSDLAKSQNIEFGFKFKANKKQ